MSKETLYDVYYVPYMTYDEVDVLTLSGVPFEVSMGRRKLCAYGLPYEEAKALVEKLGFGHSMHPTK